MRVEDPGFRAAECCPQMCCVLRPRRVPLVIVVSHMLRVVRRITTGNNGGKFLFEVGDVLVDAV